MKALLKRWWPMALCCLPGVAVAVIVGLGIAFGGAAAVTWLGGPLGLGLLVLATLACPVSMGLMMTRQRSTIQKSASNSTSMMAGCCLPDEAAPSDRLATLRAQRQALEHELAELRMQ